MKKQLATLLLWLVLVWSMVVLVNVSVSPASGVAIDNREQDVFQAALANAVEEHTLVATTSNIVNNAASCEQSDVQAAIDLAEDGDTVMVPAGSCTWSGSITIHDKSLNVIGPGKDNITITVLDVAFMLTAAPGGSNASRISGFKFDMTNGAYGVFLLCSEGEGCTQNWRVDHNEFINDSGSSKEAIFGYGNTTCFPYGLVDNNIFHDARMLSYGEAYDTGGNSRWAEPLDIGTENRSMLKTIYFIQQPTMGGMSIGLMVTSVHATSSVLTPLTMPGLKLTRSRATTTERKGYGKYTITRLSAMTPETAGCQ
jgi:hypothetical protein